LETGGLFLIEEGRVFETSLARIKAFGNTGKGKKKAKGHEPQRGEEEEAMSVMKKPKRGCTPAARIVIS